MHKLEGHTALFPACSKALRTLHPATSVSLTTALLGTKGIAARSKDATERCPLLHESQLIGKSCLANEVRSGREGVAESVKQSGFCGFCDVDDAQP